MAGKPLKRARARLLAMNQQLAAQGLDPLPIPEELKLDGTRTRKTLPETIPERLVVIQPPALQKSDQNAQVLAETLELALKQLRDILEMPNEPHGNPNYLTILKLKAKAASDITALQARVDHDRLKGRTGTQLEQLLAKIRESRAEGTA